MGGFFSRDASIDETQKARAQRVSRAQQAKARKPFTLTLQRRSTVYKKAKPESVSWPELVKESAGGGIGQG